VTYPVIVAAPNPDLKLLPGMTASISFHVDESKDVIRIPNAALRFYPDVKHVREEDKKLLEGKDWEREADESDEAVVSAIEKADARKKRNRRHVWVVDGEFLKAIEVETGLSDSKFTELVSGDLKEGQKLVTGIEPKNRIGS
jgi:HlyD family secretion protein